MNTHRISGPSILECDVLIVGSGAGGASVADVFIDAGFDVLMLEEGPSVPHAMVPSEPTESFLKMWRGAGLTAAAGRPPVAYAEGRCVGGSTEINSAIIQRPPEELVDQWSRHYRIEDFRYNDLEVHLQWAERAVNATLTPEPLGPPSDLLKTGADRLGLKVEALPRGQRDCVGTNLCAFGCPTGGKQSMSSALLAKQIARGLRLVAECRADKILIGDGCAKGVVASALGVDGRCHKVQVHAKNVFVCAGAIQTPALLRRSGVRRNVGRSLKCHPTVKALGVFGEEVNAGAHRLPLNAVTEFMPDFRLGGSLMSPGLFGMALAEDWRRRSDLANAYPHVASYYAMIRPRGTGKVSLLPGAREPMVSFSLDEADEGVLRKALEVLVEVLFAAGAERVLPSCRNHPGWANFDDVRADLERTPVRNLNLMTIHLFSSCPMGEDPSRSAVNSYGAVHGAERLYVADASIIPDAPGVNPQATVMALAHRVAGRAVENMA